MYTHVNALISFWNSSQTADICEYHLASSYWEQFPLKLRGMSSLSGSFLSHGLPPDAHAGNFLIRSSSVLTQSVWKNTVATKLKFDDYTLHNINHALRTRNCSVVSAVLQHQHKWFFEPSKGKWLPFDLSCLEAKEKQTWIIYITINNVHSDCLKNNMKKPPFNLHQQFLLALCTMSRLWCIPSTCLKRWRGKSFCSLSWY